MSQDDFVHGELRAEAARGRQRSAGLDKQPHPVQGCRLQNSGEMKLRITPNRCVGLGSGFFNPLDPQ